MASERTPIVPLRRAGARKRSPEGALAARLLRAQSERNAALGTTLFGDPAWALLLTLFVASDEGGHPTAAALCAQQPGGAERSKRLLKALEQEGMVVRLGDAADDGRAFVYLSGGTARRLRALLGSWL